MVDPALILLTRLQARARFRRWRRGLGTPKGALTALGIGLALAWMVGSLAFTLRTGFFRVDPEVIRRDGPVLLLTLVALVMVAGGGGRALQFTPAEEAFLFPGPFRRRQLIVFKLRAVAINSAWVAGFLTLASASAWRSVLAAAVGLYQIVVMLEVVAVLGGLLANLVGSIGWSRLREFVLVAMGTLGAWSLWRSGILNGDALPTGPAVMEAAARSPVLGLVATPFRIFVTVFLAPQVSSEFLGAAAVSGMIVAGLVGLVFVLDHSYLEVASVTSARSWARFERIRSSGGVGGSGRVVLSTRPVLRMPAPAWWGGVGPNLWRHLTAAIGAPGSLLFVAVAVAAPTVAATLNATGEAGLVAGLTMSGWISVFASGSLRYDFRGDMDRIEILKTLPIPPSRLALGQILAPAVLLSLIQGLPLGFALSRTDRLPPVAWSVLLFLLPANLMIVAVDNALFLLAPARVAGAQLDVATTLRQGMTALVKFAVILGVAALAGSVAAGAFFGFGRSPIAAAVAGWVVVVSVAGSLVQVVGWAFDRFDVASETPS